MIGSRAVTLDTLSGGHEGSTDEYDALIAKGLVSTLLTSTDGRGNVATLKALRLIVLEAFGGAGQGDDKWALQRWLSGSELTPVLAEYMVRALVRFQPEAGRADDVRTAFATAFGVRLQCLQRLAVRRKVC